MEHKEYIRIIPEADTAVLFVHGIVGTPNHFITQIPLVDLVPENWSVYNVLLDGHGKGVEDFSRTSMKKWKEQVWRIFEQLAEEHDRVIIAAHSMGTLFAMQLAILHPEKVPFLFLVAVPMRPWVRQSLSMTLSSSPTPALLMRILTLTPSAFNLSPSAS